MKLYLLYIVAAFLFCANASFDKSQYSEQKAIEYTVVSALAYCDADLILKEACCDATKMINQYKFDTLHAFQNGVGANSIIYTIVKKDSSKELVVAFSGTRNIQQLISELTSMGMLDYDLHYELSGAKAAQYFFLYYKEHFRQDFEENIKKFSKMYPSYNIVFTGHSLGGAMTIHAAVDAMLSKWIDEKKVVMYTFGQPRVGNHKFITALDKSQASLFRVVNNQDSVPHGPNCKFDPFGQGCTKEDKYPYHHATEIWYQPNSKSSDENNSPMDYYKICNTEDGEDQSCSNGVFHLSVPDHLVYFGIDVGGARETGCNTQSSLSELLKISQ